MLVGNNIHYIKLDLSKQISRLKKIISKNKELLIYYMATPKINIKDNSKPHFMKYKEFYVNIIKKILNLSKTNKVKFLYLSTKFIDLKNSSYARAKLLGEKELLKNKNTYIKINIVRLEEINTKQNLSILDRKLPTFTEILNKDIKMQNKILFR